MAIQQRLLHLYNALITDDVAKFEQTMNRFDNYAQAFSLVSTAPNLVIMTLYSHESSLSLSLLPPPPPLTSPNLTPVREGLRLSPSCHSGFDAVARDFERFDIPAVCE